MDAIIRPSSASGQISAPPSKSLAHRYIICAALAGGRSVIENVDFSEDILATLDCIKTLGAQVDIVGSRVTIDGILKDGRFPSYIGKRELDFKCRESGSTMRFFMGLAMLFGSPSYFYGSSTLRNRPFGIYEEICSSQGIDFVKGNDNIYICGRLAGGQYNIKGNISSQFITGLMFALPLLEGDSMIKLIPPVESRSYINLTIQALNYFGVEACFVNDNDIMIRGGQKYGSCNVRVEGDCSNAAFLEAFNTIGGRVDVRDISKDTIQGDRVYKDYFDKLLSGHAELDISDCPDLGPVLFSVAAANHGGIFTGTERLKIKESDRGTVMLGELSKFGVKGRMEDNLIEIYEGNLIKPHEALSGHNDHRIVMSLCLLLTLTGGRIEGCEAIRKSYPGFLKDISKLGIEVKVDGMDQ